MLILFCRSSSCFKLNLSIKLFNLVSSINILIEDNKLLNYDYEILRELTTFISKGTSYEAEYGKNDDLAMTLVLFAWMSTQNFFKELTSIDIRQHLLNGVQQADDGFLPFRLDDGRDQLLDDSVLKYTSNFDRMLAS